MLTNQNNRLCGLHKYWQPQSCLSNDNCFEFFVAFCNPYNWTTILADCAMIGKIVTELQNWFFIALRWFFCACHYNLKNPIAYESWRISKKLKTHLFFFKFPRTSCNPATIGMDYKKIATGLRNIKTSNLGCFDCALTSLVQTMSEHTLSFWLQHCPALHWYCSHRHNPPVILSDCARTIWIVYDYETLRNRDCGGLPHDLVDCDVI